jgi:hypothetical protein
MTKTQWARLVGLIGAALAFIALMLLAVGVWTRKGPPASLEQARLEAVEKVNGTLVAERDELQRKEQVALAAWKQAEERAKEAADRADRLEAELRTAKREASECGPPRITFPR